MSNFVSSLNPILKFCNIFAIFPFSIEDFQPRTSIFNLIHAILMISFLTYSSYVYIFHNIASMDSASVLATIGTALAISMGFFNLSRIIIVSGVTRKRICGFFEKICHIDQKVRKKFEILIKNHKEAHVLRRKSR